MTSNGKVFLVLFLSSLASFTAAANWWETGISKTITLANFDEFIGGDNHVVVEVFAQWCHYCRISQPEWDKLAEHYLGDNQNRKDIIVAKVDAGVEPMVADRFGVAAFPAYLLFKKGDIYPTSRYNNERTAEKWIGWVEGLVGPEEIPVPKDELDDAVPTIDQILQDIDLDALGDAQVDKIERKENKNDNMDDMDNMDIIVSKLDFLVDLVNGQDGDAALDQRGRDMKELKSLISDIDKKVTHKSSGANDDINFAHGISFLLLGVFLGIGISFGMINYQKLSRSRKLLD